MELNEIYLHFNYKLNFNYACLMLLTICRPSLSSTLALKVSLQMLAFKVSASE